MKHIPEIVQTCIKWIIYHDPTIEQECLKLWMSYRNDNPVHLTFDQFDKIMINRGFIKKINRLADDRWIRAN